MKRDVAAVGVYVSAIIGAGFSSGSEIIHYFSVYGKLSIIGILLSSLLFGWIAYTVLTLSIQNNANNFSEFVNLIFPKKTAYFINIAIFLFLLCIFSAMVAGSGETISILFNTDKIVGVLLILFISAIVLSFDLKGLMAANGFMSLIIVSGTLGVCFYLFNFREISVFKHTGNIILSGTVYTGYNILTAAAVLPNMKNVIKNPKKVGIISSISIFILLSSLWTILSIYYGKIPLGSIPMLTICKRHGFILSLIYSSVLFTAMLTTALANGFAITEQLKFKKAFKILLLILTGFFLSGFSFDFFIKKLYSFAGYIGIFFMIIILIKKFKKK